MRPFSIDWRKMAIGVFVFVFVFVLSFVGFDVLAIVIHWRSERDGWPLAASASNLMGVA